ncbi:hypothetical protein [Actinomadura sp. 3N407]|uniref:hypothetical protein n=1 Tax=Actinomadura sp. 3N407 TaxID=3457423 RepID=UPI003FCD37BF
MFTEHGARRVHLPIVLGECLVHYNLARVRRGRVDGGTREQFGPGHRQPARP